MILSHVGLQVQRSVSSTCRCLLIFVSTLGIPLAEKLEGPTTALVFLGVLINTIRGELRLPSEKLERLCAQIKVWLLKDRCTKRGLLSIAGQLQHAATVVWPGREFLR